MSLKQLYILLADDDLDDCSFFKEAVDELLVSTQLTAVHDGEQLMNLLNSAVREKDFSPLPDVLFLDINMPRKNGFDCLSEIKLNANLKQLPVIMFSTSFEQEVVNLLYQNGAQHFIRKPSEFSQFKLIIQQTLKLIALDLHGDNSGIIAQPAKENFVLTVQNSLII